MQEELEKIYNKLKGLKQYRDFSEKKLLAIAQRKSELDYFEKMYGVENKEEEQIASDLLDKYQDEYEFETVAEKEQLFRLIYFRLIDYRLKKIINTTYSDKNFKSIPTKDLEILYNNEKQILTIEKELGLSKAEREKTQNEIVKVQEIKKKKFHNWINDPDNRANYEYPCPYCKKWVLVRRRLDKEKDVILKHPWFVKGGILFNHKLWELLENGKITEEECKEILGGVDSEYFNWIRKNYRLEIKEK